MQITDDDLYRWFGYHPASDEQKKSYKRIEDKARELAYLITELCPHSRDTLRSVDLLRQSKMLAIASIACEHIEAPKAPVKPHDPEPTT